MKQSRKWICIACILAQLLMLAACGNAESAETQNTDAAQQTETQPVETKDPYDPELPEKDFEGYNFTFAVRGVEGVGSAWDNTDIVAAEVTGEPLNDAVYERNTYIEDTYNVKIGVMWCGDTSVALTGSNMSKAVSQLILSGEDSMDAILTSPYDTVGYTLNKYLLDLETFEYLNLSQPWWDQNANANLSFGGKIYFTTGEITIIDNKCTYLTIFSKDLVDMYELDNPYDAVREGTWSLDKVISDAAIVTTDVNGDGVMDYNDRIGYVYWQDTAFALIHGAGNTYGKINEKGEPELTFYTERMISTWDKMIGLAKSELSFGMKPGDKVLSDLGAVMNNSVEGVYLTKLENQTMLYAYTTPHGILNLRECEADFGILPTPKLNPEQDRYYSTAHGYGTALMSVPVTASDTSRTGFILEAFCAKSAQLVTPAFYDVTLTGKTIRDEDSAEMLDIIFANKVYDIGYFFMWGDLTNKVMNAWNSQNENLTSIYQSAETKALTDVEAAVEIFTSLES